MDHTYKLTDRQQEILDLIKNKIATTGSPPTRAEIADQLGFKSANAAEDHLKALAKKGVIELVSGTSRGIRLKSSTLKNLQTNHFEQAMLPLESLAQLCLPLIGRVAAGSPILAQEHVDQTYYVKATKDAKNGQIVVARIGEEVTVKRFKKVDGLIELHPENADFQTIVVEPGEPFEIEGLAVGLIRNTMLM